VYSDGGAWCADVGGPTFILIQANTEND